jgi:cyclopropane fatty-acyl-phospholipid synthase-like methyltransferase
LNVYFDQLVQAKEIRKSSIFKYFLKDGPAPGFGKESYTEDCSTDFTILSRDSFAHDADLTFMAWYDAFKRVDNEGVLILPSSFKRTLSFYLLHMAACIRVGMIEPFLIVLNKKRKSKSQLKNKTNSI